MSSLPMKYAKVNLNNEVVWLTDIHEAVWSVMKTESLTLVSLVHKPDSEHVLTMVTKMENLDHAVILAESTLYTMAQAHE